MGLNMYALDEAFGTLQGRQGGYDVMGTIRPQI